MRPKEPQDMDHADSGDFSALGLLAATTEALGKLAQELKAFEKSGKARLHTRAARIKALRQLEADAIALHDEIESLDNPAYIWLAGLLPDSTSDVSDLLRTASTHPGGELGYTKQALCDFSATARKAADHFAESRATSGRKEVLPAYAGFVAGIAAAVKPDRIKPGRGGHFEKICETVFSAAEVHAKPEGALRYFLEHLLAHYQARGHVYVEPDETTAPQGRKNPRLKAVK